MCMQTYCFYDIYSCKSSHVGVLTYGTAVPLRDTFFLFIVKKQFAAVENVLPPGLQSEKKRLIHC